MKHETTNDSSDRSGSELASRPARRRGKALNPGLDSSTDAATVLSLQAAAGNSSVSGLLASSAIQRAPQPGHVDASGPELFDVAIGSLVVYGATRADAIRILQANYVRIKTTAEQYQQDLQTTHRDFMTALADVFSLQAPPNPSIFDQTLAQVEKAAPYVTDGDPRYGTNVEFCAVQLEIAQIELNAAVRSMTEYQQGTVRGFENEITVLKVTRAAGAVAATVATGGIAGEGATALSVAYAGSAGAGMYGFSTEFATQGGEMIAGKRTEFDPWVMIEKGVEDAVLAFVTTFLAGKLSELMVDKLGSYLLAHMTDDQIARLAVEEGIGRAFERPEMARYLLSPEVTLPFGKHILSFLAGAGLGPLEAGLRTAIDHVAEDKEWPGWEEFTQEVVDAMGKEGITHFFLSVGE